MSDLIERIDHDIDGCDDEVCDSCDLLRDCRAEIERLQKRNALLEDVAAALEIERNWSPVAADPFGDHEALDCAIRDTDAALDKLREVSDE